MDDNWSTINSSKFTGSLKAMYFKICYAIPSKITPEMNRVGLYHKEDLKKHI